MGEEIGHNTVNNPTVAPKLFLQTSCILPSPYLLITPFATQPLHYTHCSCQFLGPYLLSAFPAFINPSTCTFGNACYSCFVFISLPTSLAITDLVVSRLAINRIEKRWNIGCMVQDHQLTVLFLLVIVTL